MSIKESALLDVGYPVYGAKFLDNKTLVVAGGGGEGNNGIPNKITVIKCSFKIKDKNRKLQRFREVTLPSNEDSPTCVEISKVEDNINFDRSKFNVFVGCNQSTEIIKKMNVNNHLRKYHFNDNEHLEFVDAAQLDLEVSSDSIGEYPKVINLAKDNSLGSFMTSKEPSTIYIFDPESLEVTNLILVSSSIKDFVLNPFDNGKSLCYVTSTSIEVISTSSSETVIHSTSNPIFKLDAVAKILSKYIITKVRYINEDEIILTANVRKGGVSVLKYSFKSKTITKINDFSRALKGLVALDVSVDQNLVAVAGNDFSLTLLRLSDFKVLKTFKKLHPFAITSVAFSPNGSKLATASASNAVNVFKIPKNYSKGTSKVGTLINYIFYTMIITILAIVLQASIENGQFDKYLALTKVYGGQVFEFVSEFSLHSLEYIKDKINHEKLDGDENTKKYFTIDEWSPSITSEESYTNTPLGEPVSTANDEFSEVSISEDYSSIVETDTVTETTAIISDDFAYDGDVEDLAEETVDVESEDEESVDASSEYETESSFEEAVETESEELEARDFIEEDLEGETAEEYVSNATHSSDVSGETASIDSAVDGIEISAEAPVPAESEYTILEEPEDGSSTDIEIVSESEESEDSVVSELEDASEVEGASEEVLPSEASEEVETAAPEETAEDTPVEETEEPEIKTDEETSETDIEVETVETEEADSETEAVETSEEEVLETYAADTSEAESETEAAETEGESETETVETSEGESETEVVETSEDEASETEAVETSEGETETEVAETTESEAESEVSEAAIESETEVSEEESETETPVETSETEASETELSESDTSSLTEAIDSESETSSVDAETTSLKKKKKKSKRSKKVKKHRKTAAHDEL